MIELILAGLASALQPHNLLYCALGVFLGTFLGVLPGIGTLVAVSLLFPFTYHLPPETALIMLAGIYYGTSYGGSTASILLGIPGTPANAVICADGHAMARSGRAGSALFLTTIASFVGGSLGIILIMAAAVPIASLGLRFTAVEYFSLMLMGLVAASSATSSSQLKGIAMVLAGILAGLVGVDVQTGGERYTFGIRQLYDGIGLVVLALGLFGVSEIIRASAAAETGAAMSRAVRLRDLIPNRAELHASRFSIPRGAVVGAFFGTLPGTGGLIAAFMAYMWEQRRSATPEKFGQGAVEGVVAPEAANNAADQTAFIPTLTLGIPGSASMALMLGILIIHGITPGPRLVTEHAGLFWTLIMSFWIGNILLLVINIPLIGLWTRLLSIPYKWLAPAILVFCCFGIFTATGDVFYIYVMLVVGVIGYLLRAAEYPLAPLLLGFVLGPLMEENFRRALLVARGDWTVFFTRPISAIFLALAGLILLYGLVGLARRPRKTPPGEHQNARNEGKDG